MYYYINSVTGSVSRGPRGACKGVRQGLPIDNLSCSYDPCGRVDGEHCVGRGEGVAKVTVWIAVLGFDHTHYHAHIVIFDYRDVVEFSYNGFDLVYVFNSYVYRSGVTGYGFTNVLYVNC